MSPNGPIRHHCSLAPHPAGTSPAPSLHFLLHASSSVFSHGFFPWGIWTRRGVTLLLVLVEINISQACIMRIVQLKMISWIQCCSQDHLSQVLTKTRVIQTRKTDVQGLRPSQGQDQSSRPSQVQVPKHTYDVGNLQTLETQIDLKDPHFHKNTYRIQMKIPLLLQYMYCEHDEM